MYKCIKNVLVGKDGKADVATKLLETDYLPTSSCRASKPVTSGPLALCGAFWDGAF